VQSSREQNLTEANAESLDGLDLLKVGSEPFGVVVAEPSSNIVFVSGDLVAYARTRDAAELAKRSKSLLVGLVHDTNVTHLATARNLRLMHRFCDTIIIADNISSDSDAGLEYSDIALEICEGLTNASSKRMLRVLLQRGQLARVIRIRSYSNVEDVVLKALRKLLPVTEFSRNPEIFLNLSGRGVNRKSQACVSRWVSRAMCPTNIIMCSRNDERAVETSLFLLVTQVTFPHSPSSRRLSINLHELEPESESDDETNLTLGLDQME